MDIDVALLVMLNLDGIDLKIMKKRENAITRAETAVSVEFQLEENLFTPK